ncbi:hypothetical protein V496_01179 [Pseudogymnoascus sp. VKM F-4515 (FW-2607)]|nr:hypothetical protein V496_01179 [Pseudogymnoascus sp. VKM F-4515 (FW-2607)]
MIKTLGLPDMVDLLLAIQYFAITNPNSPRTTSSWDETHGDIYNQSSLLFRRVLLPNLGAPESDDGRKWLLAIFAVFPLLTYLSQ